MKKQNILYIVAVSVLTLGLIIPQVTQATPVYTPDDFVLKIDTTLPQFILKHLPIKEKPRTKNKTYRLPVNPSIPGYNYNVDCNADGIIEARNQTGNYTCVYKTPGEYTVVISGTFPAILSRNQVGNQKGFQSDPTVYANTSSNLITSVVQWGNNKWVTMREAFLHAGNLTTLPLIAPDLSRVTDMYRMFAFAYKFNSPINNWDVAHVTDMSQVFLHGFEFNQPLDRWNVSNVTNMSGMFAGLPDRNYITPNFLRNKFNQPLDTWNVSNVTNMSGMFSASVFNQPLNNWKVDNVIDMQEMFAFSKFNQPLDAWNVSNVKNMSYMFASSEFNDASINEWKVHNVKDFSHMFGYVYHQVKGVSSKFNKPLDKWDLTSAENTNSMFLYSAFNQPIDNWNMKNVKDIRYMFKMSAFDKPIGSWKIHPSVVNEKANKYDSLIFIHDTKFSTASYDATLIGWAEKNADAPRDFNFGKVKYCTAGPARAKLISAGWKIKDGGKAANCTDVNTPGTTSPATSTPPTPIVLPPATSTPSTPVVLPTANLIIKVNGTTSTTTITNKNTDTIEFVWSSTNAVSGYAYYSSTCTPASNSRGNVKSVSMKGISGIYTSSRSSIKALKSGCTYAFKYTVKSQAGQEVTSTASFNVN